MSTEGISGGIHTPGAGSRFVLGGQLFALAELGALVLDAAALFPATSTVMPAAVVTLAHVLLAACRALAVRRLLDAEARPVVQAIGWAAILGWGSVAALTFAWLLVPSLMFGGFRGITPLVFLAAPLPSIAVFAAVARGRWRAGAYVSAAVALLTVVARAPSAFYASVRFDDWSARVGFWEAPPGWLLCLFHLPMLALALAATWPAKGLVASALPSLSPYRGAPSAADVPPAEYPEEGPRSTDGWRLHAKAIGVRALVGLVTVLAFALRFPLWDYTGVSGWTLLGLTMATGASATSFVALTRVTVNAPRPTLALRWATGLTLVTALLDVALLVIALKGTLAARSFPERPSALLALFDDVVPQDGSPDQARWTFVVSLLVASVAAALLVVPLLVVARRHEESLAKDLRRTAAVALLAAATALVALTWGGSRWTFPAALLGVFALGHYAWTARRLTRRLATRSSAPPSRAPDGD